MYRNLVFVFAILLSGLSRADTAPADDACTTLLEVRAHLLAMVKSTDKASQDGFKRKVYEASARLESILGAMADSDAPRAKAIKPVWESFKQTREKEIIPAVYAGRASDAKSIAIGIQAERMLKMKAVLGCK